MKDTDIFVKFKHQYSLSPIIPVTAIPTEIFKVDSINIEFITENNNLTKFNLTLERELNLQEAYEELDHFSKFLTHLMSIKSNCTVEIKLLDCECTDKYGIKKFYSDYLLEWENKIKLAKINIQNDLIRVSKSSKKYFKQYVSYLAKSMRFFIEGFYDHSIIEGFKIIEYEKEFRSNDKFKNYNVYRALRNILVHSPRYYDPYYDKEPLSYFKEKFSKDDFDYIIYEPDDNLIVLDLDSVKTQNKLKLIAYELIDELKKHLELNGKKI
jgi:hypothetical protein